MKILVVLKHLMNFIFLAFILSSVFMLSRPFFDNSMGEVSNTQFIIGQLVLPLVHVGFIFMILFYLRKFVIQSFKGDTLQKSTTKHLKLAGIFCIVYGVIRLPQIFGIIQFYSIVGMENPFLLFEDFLNLGSLYYTILIGLFFIYLSKIMDQSNLIKQENQLTI